MRPLPGIASTCPQPRVSFEGASGILPFRRFRLGFVRENMTVLRSKYSILNLPVQTFDSRSHLDDRSTLYPLQIHCLLIEQYVQQHGCACCGTLKGVSRQYHLLLACHTLPKARVWTVINVRVRMVFDSEMFLSCGLLRSGFAFGSRFMSVGH